MKRFLCVALLCAVGCASVPNATETAYGDNGKEQSWQTWIPGFFADLWETVDARVAMDYNFGAHLKATDLARVGMFDYSDFSVLGIESGIFNGDWVFPNMDPTTKNGSWDLGMKFGMGLGAEATLHTWEVVDALSQLVGGWAGWSLNGD